MCRSRTVPTTPAVELALQSLSSVAGSLGGLIACCKSRRVPCAKTVPESDVLMPLGLALSEKQIPQITENTEKPEE